LSEIREEFENTHDFLYDIDWDDPDYEEWLSNELKYSAWLESKLEKATPEAKL